MTLKKYYTSNHWRRFRKKIYDNKDCTCQICGTNRWTKYKRKEGYKKPKIFNIHHKHYNSLYNESKDDVLVLCQSCHEFCHKAEKMSKKSSIYQSIYDQIKQNTQWEYESFRNKDIR